MDSERTNSRAKNTRVTEEKTKSTVDSALTRFIEVLFTKLMELAKVLDSISLTPKLILLLIIMSLGMVVSIIALFYLSIKALKGY